MWKVSSSENLYVVGRSLKRFVISYFHTQKWKKMTTKIDVGIGK